MKCGKKALIQIRSIAPGDQTAIGASACNNNVPTAQQKRSIFCVSNFQNGRESCICSFKFSTLVFFLPPSSLPFTIFITHHILSAGRSDTSHWSPNERTLHGSWHGQSDSYQLNPLFPPFPFPRIGINAAIFHTGGIERGERCPRKITGTGENRKWPPLLQTQVFP